MSEYIILWQSHRKGEYGIALANSFGGITQVMFMVLPFTLLAIGGYQAWVNPGHPDLPLLFSFSNMLLLLFLFPMLFVLLELLQENHTLDILDTTIMLAIFLLLIALLLSYGTVELEAQASASARRRTPPRQSRHARVVILPGKNCLSQDQRAITVRIADLVSGRARCIAIRRHRG